MFCLTYLSNMGPDFTSPYLDDYDKDGATDILLYNRDT